jgi:low affinity Fe/Cu permease
MEVRIMAAIDELKTNVADLITKVAAQGTVIDSAVVLIQGQTKAIADLQVKLDEAIANGNPAEIQAASDAIKAQNDAITAETQKLAAAVPQNT